MNTTTRLIHCCGLIAALALASCQPPPPAGPSGSYPDAGLKQPNKPDNGVVLVYRKGTLPVAEKPCQIAVGDSVVVRVHNIDGWLIGKLTDNRITGEPAMTAEQRKNYALFQQLVGDESSEEFLKRYDAAANATPAAKPATTPTPVPPAAPTVTLTPTPAPASAATPPTPALKPLPDGVTVKKLREAKNAYDSLLATAKRQLFLVINNSQFRNLKPDNADEGTVGSRVKAAPGTTVHEFEYRLRRRPGDEDAWSGLYDGTRAIHDVRVSVGIELDQRVFVLDTAVFPQAEAKVQRVRLELFHDLWLWGVLAALAGLLVGIVVLSASTGLLRDNDLPLRADGLAQFSLSRIQLAFWTYLVVGAFLIIWLVTDRLDTLNTTILALLGISSGTTLASKLANSLTLTGGATPKEPSRAARRGKPINELRAEIEGELRALETEAVAIEKQRRTAPGAGLDEKMAALSLSIQRVKDDLDYLGRNGLARFFSDMLSENGRVTLHRLQVVVWTIVLGIVFIAKVKRELSMPVFGDTLLGLMGLSSLTYVALKVPELKRVETEVKATEPKA